MKTLRVLLLAGAVVAAAFSAAAQGSNHGDGGPDGNYTSLSERLFNLENKHNNFNIFINTSTALQLDNYSGDLGGAFRAKHLRLDIKGSIGDHITYRLRHRLNAPNAGASLESFSKATDFMMIGYKINDRFTLIAGKMAQFWGGYDYDENPLYIYEYSDVLNAMEIFYGGVALAWYPLPGQEFVFNVSNSYNNTFAHEYGGAVALVDGTSVQAADFPLSYMVNWNGSLFSGLLETRWGTGFINQAKGYRNWMILLGQKLILPTFNVYFDWTASWEPLDRLRIATAELGGTGFQKDVFYQSFVVKSNWQFAPKWNLMTKAMYDLASVPGYANYRKAVGYIGALEYYPVKDQDFRFFLSYIGHHRFFTVNTLPDQNTGRLELGFIYRIKAY